MGINEFIVLISMYLGWIAVVLIPVFLLRAIKKIHKDEDYLAELVILIVCALVLWGRTVV